MADTGRRVVIRGTGCGRFRTYSMALKVRRNRRKLDAFIAQGVAGGADRTTALLAYFGSKATP